LPAAERVRVAEKDEPVVDGDISSTVRRFDALPADLDRHFSPAHADVTAVIMPAAAHRQRLVGGRVDRDDPRSLHPEVAAP
jgi:hypothetical protein